MSRPQTLSEMIEALESGARLDSVVQREARESTVCPCCGKDKRTGLLVCAVCYDFETPTGLVPYRASGMVFSRWLEQAHLEQAETRGWKVVVS